MSTNFNFVIPTSNVSEIKIPLSSGGSIFILGANGTGKSILMHRIYTLNKGNAKKITAHRKTWFEHNSVDLTTHTKNQYDEGIKHSDNQANSRFRDDYFSHRSSISIYELINSENLRARQISAAVDKKDIKTAGVLSKTKSPLHSINELLNLSNIPIILSIDDKEQIFASKNGSPLYSIAELSDGERNALLICSDVLTTPPGTLIMLDEPEKHLHRSIISPLLSSLFLKRPDCAFVISTHDVMLPIDTDSNVILLRNCTWKGKDILNWDADLIKNTHSIPDDVKKEILGSKRNILFIEGDIESLDKQIYQLIFPEFSVIPQGNCAQVEKVVEGIRETESIHWINAYGLIDADDRTEAQIAKLTERGIYALKAYSVEYLYYNVEIIKQIAKRFHELTGKNEQELFNNATSSICKNVAQHKDRLCQRLCEKQVRNQVLSSLPKHKEFKKERYKIEIDLKEVIEKEEAFFDKYIADGNIDGLLARYPIRETQALDAIANGFGVNRKVYESIVRKLIIDDKSILSFYQKLLYDLSKEIQKEP